MGSSKIWIPRASYRALPMALGRGGMELADMDLIEINEAFAAKTILNRRLLEIDDEKLNVHGGAIALGHPVGASGARILVTLWRALCVHGGVFGAAAIGGVAGVTSAVVIKRES